ncbi:uncharacterized protein LOC123536302 [Mercenaria mercenaria]|uniref:uncharacterized protein LOC123536302 n=1 Tax=Mercenaria mercenaria TaxID=6596 RepID=UPI00234F9EE0|nr:uncharacterized protein LOC123536302 [Mercenaria mercenaria]
MAFPPIEPLPEINIWEKKKDKTAYLHKPPTIQPNYGQRGKHSLLPKTNIARVLLYENTMQDNVLDVQLKYLKHQRRSFRFSHRKHRYAFIDSLNHRRKWHEMWEAGYQRMKDAFIAKYGTRYMPVPTPEPEVDPFTIYARLAPPINVLCFYLDSQEPKQTKKEKPKDAQKTLLPPHKPSMDEYLHDHERLINNQDSELRLYTRSTEDPRFRRLEEVLAPPLFRTDGYNQLSPGYCKADAKVKKWAAVRHRGIVLPRFYTRHQVASRDSARSKPLSGKDSVQKDSTFPVIEDDRSSLSELSSRGSAKT